jgi:hypothetical protein
MGSNFDGFSRVGSRLLVGAMPIDPARAAAKSDNISAGRFVATIVSILAGFSTIRIVMASTYILSHSTSLKFFATSVATLSQNTIPFRCALLFVTTVNLSLLQMKIALYA